MVRLIVCVFCLLLALEGGAASFRGRWQCVALDASHLVLTGDYGDVQEQLFRKHFAARGGNGRRGKSGWAADFRFHIAGTEAIAEYRPQVTAMLRDHPQIKIHSAAAPVSAVRVGYWLSPVGQSRFPDENGRMRLSRNADAAHYLFLTLNRPLADGEAVTIELPAGERLDYVRHLNRPSPLFKINQIGYLPTARKYAYIGAWLGTAGPLPLHGAMAGKPFHLVDASNGETVFTGTLQARMPDPVNNAGTPFSGEEVLELDFSRFTTPGTYYLAIPEYACSDRFRIGDDTMAEAFYIHARGLYHQRCGIAKEEPYTHWVQAACHPVCLRGGFPPETGHYGKGKRKHEKK